MSSPSSPAVPRRPPPSSAFFRRFPLFSAVACRPPPSPAVLHHPLPSPITPYKNMSQIVGLVVLPNDGRPGSSRTRTDGNLSSRPVIFSRCPTSKNERRGRTTFCRPVSSRALGSPPAGPYGGPGRLRTLVLSEDDKTAMWDTNMQGVHEDCGFVVGTVVNGGGRQGTVGDGGGR